MLRYIGEHYVEGTGAEIRDLKNGMNLTGSNPDLRTLTPGMQVKITDASGGAVMVTAVSHNQISIQGIQDGGDGAAWGTVQYDLENDSTS